MDDEIRIEGEPRPPVKVGTLTVVDMETGEVLEERRNAGVLLPPPPGTCPECGDDHPHDQPHNRDSSYYELAFRATHGRYPTWTDAMRHCPVPVIAAWRIMLVEAFRLRGLPVPADLAGDGDPRPSFTCPKCGRTSHNPGDVREAYCGACHEWFGDRRPSPGGMT